MVSSVRFRIGSLTDSLMTLSKKVFCGPKKSNTKYCSGEKIFDQYQGTDHVLKGNFGIFQAFPCSQTLRITL